jgi:putative addiction module killer protein
MVTQTLPYGVIEIREYTDALGRSPFGRWFDRLPAQAAAKVRTAVARMEAGNLSNVKSVGEGVMERVIDWGPGYRIYFGRDGDKLIILLGGGSKKGQQDDIRRAKECWKDYQQRKARE